MNKLLAQGDRERNPWRWHVQVGNITNLNDFLLLFHFSFFAGAGTRFFWWHFTDHLVNPNAQNKNNLEISNVSLPTICKFYLENHKIGLPIKEVASAVHVLIKKQRGD